MSTLRNKAKASSLREKFIKQKEDKENKASKKDLRFVNYYDLDFGEKMKIRLLPVNEEGDYWYEYATHGPNLKVRGLDSISCAYTSSGEECPACSYSFDFHNDGDKDSAQKWRRKETYIGQCIVMDSPVEVNETEDGNPVKLIYLPYGMIEVIQEAIMEGQVDVPMNFDFIIKKTKNQGGRAAYGKSFFDKNEEPLDDELIDALEDQLYNVAEEVPAPSSTEEVEEWLDKAIEAVEKAESRQNRKGGGKSSHHDDGDTDPDDDGEGEGEDDSPKTTKSSASSLLQRLKNKQKEED